MKRFMAVLLLVALPTYAFAQSGTVVGGSAPPNGAAGGTLGGTYPNPSIAAAIVPTTSVTSPIHYGGSSAGSTALLNGTSNGSPSSAFLNFQSNGQFAGIGNTSPKTYLDLNENLSSSPALVLSTSLAKLQAADTVNGGFEMVAYGAGTNAGNIVASGVAGGTAASPSGSSSGAYLFNMRGYGYNSGWQLGALYQIITAEAWSSGHQGALHAWFTTPVGSTTIAETMRLYASGGLSIGGPSDPGNGTLILKKQTFASLTACSSNTEGTMAAVTDSSTATWGATITGSSTNHVLGYCDGTNWTVMGK